MLKSMSYLYALRTHSFTGKKICYPVFVNTECNIKEMNAWVLRNNNCSTGVYEYSFIPNSCVKRIFGGDGWSSTRDFPVPDMKKDPKWH